MAYVFDKILAVVLTALVVADTTGLRVRPVTIPRLHQGRLDPTRFQLNQQDNTGQLLNRLHPHLQSPVIQTGLYNSLSTLLIDSDTLQEKPCGGGHGGSQPGNIWRLQSLLEPVYTCNCKIFSDRFELRRIDYSRQAQVDCLSAISGYYCCQRT